MLRPVVEWWWLVGRCLLSDQRLPLYNLFVLELRDLQCQLVVQLRAGETGHCATEFRLRPLAVGRLLRKLLS